ncbi:hypothetical protein K8I28_14310 [bacterium]|nr:hypothetical protein [bacterium]
MGHILRMFLQRIRWFIYLIVTFILFLAFYIYIGEDPRESINPAVMIDNTVYWFEYGRYAPDLKDIQYFGVVKCYMEGDTTKLPFSERFITDYMDSRVYKHLGKYRDYATQTSDPKGFYENNELEKIGNITIELKITQWIGFPVFYRIWFTAGNERKPIVYRSLVLSSEKKYKLVEVLEDRIDFLFRTYAKRFHRIKEDFT